MRLLLLLLLMVLAAPAARAQDLPPPYRPVEQVTGTISVWGHGAYGKRLNFVEGLVAAWEEGFRRFHPDVTFENRLHGTASAIGALYTGTGDVALMGREIWDPEIAAFREVRGYAPTGIDVMTGSFNVRNKGYAITVFTHKDNPIAGLTLAQLEAIYGVERRRGHAPVRTWGDLGLGGEWADRPVTLYGLPIARGFADYVQERVFLGSQKWKPELREYADQRNSVSTATDGATRMLADLAKDPHGIGYAGLVYNHPGVKVLAIAEEPGRPFVFPATETVRARTYPLTRIITAYVDRAPGKPMEPRVREFLRFLLSREGQEAVARHGGGYLPLSARLAGGELVKLQE